MRSVVKWMNIVATVFLLCSSATLAQNESRLVGVWLVTIEGEANTRTFIITEAATATSGTLPGAKYGLSGGNLPPVDAKLSRSGDVRQLQITTLASSVIAEYEQPDGSFKGTFTFKGGAVKPVLIARVADESLPKAAARKDMTATVINIVGSDNGTAISGFDVVAFFTTKKATAGTAQYSHPYAGAIWLFSTLENLKAFQSDPERFVPAWGGQCALAVSENGLSKKKLSGNFEFVDGKLYLFAFGNNAKDGPLNEFMYGRWGRASRIRDGDKYWPNLKKRLEDSSIVQPNASNYQKTRFE